MIINVYLKSTKNYKVLLLKFPILLFIKIDKIKNIVSIQKARNFGRYITLVKNITVNIKDYNLKKPRRKNPKRSYPKNIPSASDASRIDYLIKKI